MFAQAQPSGPAVPREAIAEPIAVPQAPSSSPSDRVRTPGVAPGAPLTPTPAGSTFEQPGNSPYNNSWANGGCGGCGPWPNNGCGGGGPSYNGGYAFDNAYGRRARGAPAASGCYGPDLAAFENAASCGADAGCCQQPAACPWFASVNALFMGRNQANRVWTTYETGHERTQLMNTDFGLGWQPGGEICIGRRFCCDQWAISASYWSLGQFTGSSHMSMWTNGLGSTLSTPLWMSGAVFDFDPATYNPATATTMHNYFDNAQAHCLWRTDEVQNIEINVIRERLCSTDCSPLDIDCSVGVRYFRFKENLLFGSLQHLDGSTRYTDYGCGDRAHQAFIDEDITNDLVGLQFGADAGWCFCHGCRVFVAPRVGIYNNHIQSDFRAYRGDGAIPTPVDEHGVPTGCYPVRSSVNVFSVLAQLDVGLQWQFACHWSAQVGYRLVAATGIGLADNQIPMYIVDVPELSHPRHNGELILHGAFAGITWNF